MAVVATRREFLWERLLVNQSVEAQREGTDLVVVERTIKLPLVLDRRKHLQRLAAYRTTITPGMPSSTHRIHSIANDERATPKTRWVVIDFDDRPQLIVLLRVKRRDIRWTTSEVPDCDMGSACPVVVSRKGNLWQTVTVVRSGNAYGNRWSFFPADTPVSRRPVAAARGERDLRHWWWRIRRATL